MWIDASTDAWTMYDSISKMLAESPILDAEEWAIDDYEGFSGFCIRPAESLERVAKLAASADERTYRFIWQGIEIEAVYQPRRHGGIIALLEILSVNPKCAPLPITSTGYKSFFHEPGTIEASGNDVAEYIVAWLDEEATSPEWQEHQAVRMQGDFFG